jgi:5'-nucleotidase
MTFLLTNDDGIEAPGLAALAQAAETLGQTVWIAPTTHLSGCSHRVTTDGPIRVEKRHEGRWALHGTPADCVRLGLARLAPHTQWVLSGLNAGGNLGADVHHSGTVAAVREAALHGRPGIALSQYRKRGLDIDWPRTIAWMQNLLPILLAKPLAPGTFWNVNLPHLRPDEPEPQIVFCPLEPGPLPLEFLEKDNDHWHYAGDYHGRVRQPGSDVDVCFTGNIAVTLLAAFTITQPN